MAIGIWAATAGLGVALGPVVGGFLLDHFWWGSIFIVNVPMTVIALVAGRRLRPRVARPGRAADRLDRRGALRRRARRAASGRSSRRPSKGWTSRARCSRAGALRRRRAGRRSSSGSAASTSRCSTCALFRTRGSPRPAPRSWCCSSRSSGSSSCRRSTCSSSSATRRSAAGVRMLPYAGAMIVFAPLSSKLVARFGTKRVVTRRDAAVRDRARDRGDDHRSTRGYGRLGDRAAVHGRGHGARGRAGDRVDHGLAPAGAREHRVRRQRHDARARRRARRRDRRQHHVVALREPAARRTPGRRPRTRRRGRPRVARRRRPDRPERRRRRGAARGVRPRDVARVDRGRASSAALGAVIAWRYLPAQSAAPVAEPTHRPTSTARC